MNRYGVKTTSLRRHDVTSTFARRCFGALRLCGLVAKITYFVAGKQQRPHIRALVIRSLELTTCEPSEDLNQHEYQPKNLKQKLRVSITS